MTDNITFDVTSDDEFDYSKPILFNNCANPITFSYVNSNIKEDYTLNDASAISYNGTLLKRCNITLNSLETELSFLITITNNLDEIFTCPITLKIPLEQGNESIYEGNLIVKQNCNYMFIKH